MTSHYARLSDKTIRGQRERTRKVNITGEQLATDTAPLADAVWMKNNLARAKMALPNGYCETVRIRGRVNRPSARWFFGGARCGFRRRWWYRVDRRIAGPFGRWRGPGGVGWFPARLRR
jgi:hypothetical protein